MPLVIRDDPGTPGPDGSYLRYTGDEHLVLGGTEGNDTLIASIGDDTLYGDGGNDRLEGGFGNDTIRGGAGDDIITDAGGDDVLHGEDGNDVIHGGNGLNLILAGFGNDFVITGEDASEAFGGPGNDFILGSNANEQDMGNEGDDWLEGGLLDGSPGDNFDPLGRDLIIGNDVYVGSGQPDIMNAEGGDDIMVGSSGPGDKYLGASGFDWATFKDDQFGVSIDMAVRAFDIAPVPVAAGIVARFSAVEGLSGSAHSDLLRGDDADAAVIATAGAQGSVLTNFDLIDGLRELVGAAGAGPDGILGTADDQFGAGNIILGGDGSDLIEGRGGDDLIDGDAWLNVRISVRQNGDGSGPEIASYDSMVPMVPLMLDGTYNPGQLVIAREILPGSGGFNFDTARFSDIRGNYAIEGADLGVAAADLDGDGFITVRHVDAADPTLNGLDGVDRLRGIERLHFNDQSVVLVEGLNAEPVGLLTLSDTTPEVGELISVSAAGVTDADNPGDGAITGPITFVWQFDPGTGLFEDITRITGVGVEAVTGPSFRVTPDLEGLPLRVLGLYQDANGVLETLVSAPTGPVAPVGVNDAPVGTVLISDTTPTEGQPLTVTSDITDPDGTTSSVFSIQWQAGNGLTFASIAGATAASFTPTQDQVGLQLRVVVSYTDDGGTLEQVASAATEVVGDVAIGTAAGETLRGTAGQDSLQGLGGNDSLIGLAGDDLLQGGAGNDVMVGGAGADTMLGGEGNDRYGVDDPLDLVTELPGAGTDTVWTTLSSYALGANPPSRSSKASVDSATKRRPSARTRASSSSNSNGLTR